MNQSPKTKYRMRPNKNLPIIAMLANYPKGTGYAWWLMERFWHEISDTATTRSWQSMVIYPQPSHKMDAERNSLNPSQLETFLSKGTLKDTYRVYQLIRHFNIRSLYLTDRPFRSWKYLVLRLAGIKSIVVHDHTPGDRPAIKGIKGLIKKLLNSPPWFTATLYVAISPLMRQRHLLNARIPATRIATVTNGIIVRDLIPNARELLVQKFGLQSNCYIVCAIGRLNPYKRFDFAIKCIARLGQRNPETNPVLLLIGDGPDRSRLQGLADSAGSACKVIFTGQLNDVWPILCGVDTVIHPSAGEGLSLAILEAMAAAQPVVVPSLPSVSQTIEHGSTGLIYHEGSLTGARELLYLLSRDITFRNRLGTNARQQVLEHYQLERTVEVFNSTVLPTLF